MMKALAILPLVSSYQVMDTHEVMGVDSHASYEGMRATLKGISAMQMKGEIDTETINTVEEILENITTQLLAALDQDRIHAQSILDAALGLIEQCDTNKQNWADQTNATGVFKTYNDDVSAKQTTFDNCRDDPANTVDDEASLCSNATDHCNTYSQQVCDWSTSGCVKPGAGAYTAGDSDEMHTYMCCLEEFFRTQKTTYYSNRQACIDAVNEWETKVGECDTAQDNFEQAFCAREHNVESTCHTYRTCRNTQQTNYVSVKNEVQHLQQIFQAQRVALACLQCYGGKILANATDLSSCEDSTVTCDSFTDCPTVNFDPVPDCIPCSEPVTDTPCKTEFTTTYYAKYDNTCTPSAECTACGTHHSGFTQDEGPLSCEEVPMTEFEINNP